MAQQVMFRCKQLWICINDQSLEFGTKYSGMSGNVNLGTVLLYFKLSDDDLPATGSVGIMGQTQTRRL